MGIFNYFLIGLIFSLTVDFLLSLKVFKKHPRIKNIKWGWNERLLATFVLDYLSDKYADHPAFEEVPEWGWGARIMFILFWPLGVGLFLYTFIKTYFFKK